MYKNAKSYFNTSIHTKTPSEKSSKSKTALKLDGSLLKKLKPKIVVENISLSIEKQKELFEKNFGKIEK